MMTFDFKITVETPLHIGAGTGDSASNSPLLLLSRDSRGRPCLSASLLKGAHRMAAAAMASGLGLTVCQGSEGQRLCHPIQGKTPCLICQLFGSSWVNGRLYYRDVVPVAPVSTSAVTRTVIRTTQTKRRTLRSTTSIQAEFVPAGTVFSGKIRHLITDKAHIGLALAALRSIQTLGALNSAGYGLCKMDVQAFDPNHQLMNSRDLGGALSSFIEGQGRRTR